MKRLLTRRRGRPMIEPMSNLGSFVRARREALDLSQQELAERAGLTRGAIGMIEQGRRVELEPRSLLGLAGALGIEVKELLSRAQRNGVNGGTPPGPQDSPVAGQQQPQEAEAVEDTR